MIGVEYLLISKNNKWILFEEYQNADNLLNPSEIYQIKQNRKKIIIDLAKEKEKTFAKRKAKIKNSNNEPIHNYYGEPLYASQIEFLDKIESILGFPIPKKTVLRYNSIGFKSSNGYILHLSLYRCGLEEIPSSIRNLTKLRSLYLRTNKITKIPDILFSISSLRILYLLDNQISELSKDINNLKKLEELNLGMNQLKSLPEQLLSLKKLKLLTLSCNELTFLPVELLLMQSVERIYVNGNKLEQFCQEQYFNNFWKRT
ncbi:leucine-rich repeat domain-containing protein [Candidatus Lokiarchaeum ossiferum]